MLPNIAKTDPWTTFRRALTDVDSSKVDAARGLRNAVGVALPLAIGAMTGHVQPALVAATGALNVGFADSAEPYLPRARRMVFACVLVSLGVFLGAVSGWTPAGAVVVAAVWTFGAGMLVSLGTQTGNMGVSSSCVLLIFAAHPLPAVPAALCGCLALAGGLLQTGLSVLLWPVQPYEPERIALAALYVKLANLVGWDTAGTESPPASAGTLAAANALAPRQGDHSVEGDRYRALLDQGERIRICLLTLNSLRREDHSANAPLDDYLSAVRDLLEAVAETLRTGNICEHAAASRQRAESILEAFRMRKSEKPVLMSEIATQMDALNRQARMALTLSEHSTPSGRLAFFRAEAARAWRIHSFGTLSTLRANLTMQSTAFRHALRLSACVAAGDALGRSLGWYRPYWLPLTVVVVLKPDFSATFSRGVLRLAGTFAGLGVATLLFHWLPRTLTVEIALIMAVTFLLRWSGPAHYGVLAVCVSQLVVLLVALTGVEPMQVIFARGRNTALGGVLALLAYWLWPTWERSQVRDIFVKMLDAYRRHFDLLTRAFAGEDLAAAMQKTRAAVRLSRSNLEASVDRLAAEPATKAGERDAWSAMLASSHIFANSLILLRATLLADPEPLRSVGQSPAFQHFSAAVLQTLGGLIQALRGADPATIDFPNLREAHYRLIHSGEPMAAPHTLISIETDKMVNSLNTLREQVSRLDR